MVFENTEKTKNKNTPTSPNKFFCFQEQKTSLENRNQTGLKSSLICFLYKKFLSCIKICYFFFLIYKNHKFLRFGIRVMVVVP